MVLFNPLRNTKRFPRTPKRSPRCEQVRIVLFVLFLLFACYVYVCDVEMMPYSTGH